MKISACDSPAAWNAAQLDADRRWMFALDDKARRDLVEAVWKARDPEKTLLDYRREDFDLGSSWTVIDAALSEVKRGRGVALIRGLPRESLKLQHEEHEITKEDKSFNTKDTKPRRNPYIKSTTRTA